MRTRPRNPGSFDRWFTRCCSPVSLFWPKFELLAQQNPPSVVARAFPGGTVTTILGRDVVDSSGDDVGQLVDIMVDKAGRPVAGVIDVGGFLGVGKRRVAVAGACCMSFRIVTARASRWI